MDLTGVVNVMLRKYSCQLPAASYQAGRIMSIFHKKFTSYFLLQTSDLSPPTSEKDNLINNTAPRPLIHLLYNI